MLWGCGAAAASYSAGRSVQWYSHFWNSDIIVGSSWKQLTSTLEGVNVVIISWTVYYTTLKVNILYTKQHEWMVRIQCSMKRARHKIIILIWFYLLKLQKANKTILFRAICLSIKKNKEMLTKVRIMVIWERSMIEKGTRVGGFWGPGYVSFLLWGFMSVCWNH